jgi:hypothetical protein
MTRAYQIIMFWFKIGSNFKPLMSNIVIILTPRVCQPILFRYCKYVVDVDVVNMVCINMFI